MDQAEAAEVRKESMASLSELSFLEKGRVQFSSIKNRMYEVCFIHEIIREYLNKTIQIIGFFESNGPKAGTMTGLRVPAALSEDSDVISSTYMAAQNNL